jgi:hypothetical protein
MTLWTYPLTGSHIAAEKPGTELSCVDGPMGLPRRYRPRVVRIRMMAIILTGPAKAALSYSAP